MPPSLQTFDLWLIVTMLYSMTWDDVDSAFHSAMEPVTAGPCSELEALQFLSDNRRPPPSLAKSLAQFISKQTQLKEVDIFISLPRCIATALATSSQSIRSLSCHICPEGAGISVSETIGLISSSCSVLEELTAIVNTEFRVSDLRGLLSCNTLRTLRISYWTLHSQLEAKEIEAMAISWPGLEVLHILSNNPFPRPPTPLSILTTIARCMRPTLKDLGVDLFVDETVPLATTLEAVPFIGLQNLVIGDSSTIQNGHEQDVAMYLGSILPHDVKISMKTRRLLGIASGLALESLDSWNKVVGLRQTSRSASAEEAAPGI
ncbi:hypothetical protein FRC04_004160 [Tulasnella sp. 424]|nr:hypothetical protein FRC04_004160 [Tulasnella sp. 424]KAG8968901.1 hypothetical protein FRC05_001269 [Tulasnella sp. 425]